MPVGAPLGNQNAAKGRVWRNALDRAIAQDDGKKLRAAAEKLLTAAAEGEEWAMKELGDRLDGKPGQAITVAGDPEAPLQSKVTVELVRASTDSGPT